MFICGQVSPPGSKGQSTQDKYTLIGKQKCRLQKNRLFYVSDHQDVRPDNKNSLLFNHWIYNLPHKQNRARPIIPNHKKERTIHDEFRQNR
jgi:hypothetical protein